MPFLPRRLIHEFDDYERVWHGSPWRFNERTLDSTRAPYYNFLDEPEGTYFTPDRDLADFYRQGWQKGPGATGGREGALIRAEIPGPQYLLDMDHKLADQHPYIRERLGAMSEDSPDMRHFLDISEGPSTLLEYMYDDMASYGARSPGSRFREYGIPGLRDEGGGSQRVIWNPGDWRTLGRSRAIGPLAVGAGAAGMAGEARAEDLAALERVMAEKPGIYGPEHPALLGGIDAVRSIPGADFMLGPLLDVGEDVAFGDKSTIGEKVGAALVGLEAIPIGRVMSMAGKGISRK